MKTSLAALAKYVRSASQTSGTAFPFLVVALAFGKIWAYPYRSFDADVAAQLGSYFSIWETPHVLPTDLLQLTRA